MVPPAPLVAPSGLDGLASLVAYEGPAALLVARVKYGGARTSIGWLATGMAALVGPWQPDVVTWVPASRARRRRSGVDHGALLARAVARRLHRPARRLLHRSSARAQTGASRAERLRGPGLQARPAPAGRRVLVVDDVCTTGASLAAAASVLRHAGAIEVWALTAARTPLHHRV